MITTHIITKNNEKTIKRSISSIKDISNEIICVDLGSSDSTIKILKEEKVKIFSFNFEHDYSKIRNNIVNVSSNDWQFYLHPWEAISEGQEILLKATKNLEQNYKVIIFRNEIITKELRLWNKNSECKFEKPIYENLEPNIGKIINCTLYSENDYKIEYAYETLIKWKNNSPTSPEPYYYLLFYHLSNGNYDDFIVNAEHYLFTKTKIDKSVYLIKYYLSKVYLYIKRNAYKALQGIMECIGEYPYMAEYWCLLGDIYLHLKETKRAKCFFENAIILGKNRQIDDDLPVEISKYEDYPNNMIESIKNMF